MSKHVAQCLRLRLPTLSAPFPAILSSSDPVLGATLNSCDTICKPHVNGQLVAVWDKRPRPELELHVRDSLMFHGNGTAADRLRKPSTSLKNVVADLSPEKGVREQSHGSTCGCMEL